MPPPFAVWLVAHDEGWARQAAAAGEALAAAVGPGIVAVHHIGSTAIPGLVAKPVIDLLPVVTDLATLDGAREEVEAIGFRWHGEYGLAGRRYLTLEDAAGTRLVQAHCYAAGDPAIRRHLAFRDHLRARADLAAAYAAEKRRCAARHAGDSHAYTDCKAAWIRRVEAEALAAI